MLNLTQMSGLVGQQSLRGKRIEKGYSNRTLSLFQKENLSARAHGFVSSNYGIGMDPVESFFNAMVGRDSLMDTAMRTPKSGYMQRRLMNSLQDLKVWDDMTVRDSNKNIVQFFAGEDGTDPTKSDWGRLNWIDYVEHG